MKPIQLTSPRLILRGGKKTDALSLFNNYCSSSYSSKFLTRLPHTSVEQTYLFLNEWCIAPWINESRRFAWIITLINSDEAIGVFLVENNQDEAQIHYGISQKHERKGLMTEAGEAVITWLKNQKKIKKIWTECDIGNVGSIHLLEKWGFQNKKLLKDRLMIPSFSCSEKRDCYLYVLNI
ncbi:MAG TPA: GNAT family protein [Legionellaceae bacterium]|nr:GNAT family protein [Legionellaceae bacterium]